MSNMSYINVIDNYHSHKNEIDELMGSILSGINELFLFEDEARQQKAMDCLVESYPFVDMLYTLDAHGRQASHNILPYGRTSREDGQGRDRSQRPYFLLARESESIIVTSPYLSTASRSLCISAATKIHSPDGELLGFIVLDIDLTRTIEFMLGDSRRRKFEVLFKIIYMLIAVGLFVVVGLLLHSSWLEFMQFMSAEVEDVANPHYLRPFGIIIYLTLALAIFDWAKTTLEEEVLMHKDVFRHSSTRRTITRFMAAILVAVSIESLLLMFKSVLSDGHMLSGAVAMMLAAAALLVALGVYVFLGAKAENILLTLRKINTTDSQINQ